LDELALLPFAEMSSKSSDSLKSIANYLLVVIEQSLFQANRALVEYKSAHAQRSEALRLLLEHAEISEADSVNSMAVDTEVVEDPPSRTASSPP
jgi:uncharacterized protein YbjQ (UPF0145 family)